MTRTLNPVDRVLELAEALDQIGDRLVVIGGRVRRDTGAPPKRAPGMKAAERRARDAAARYGPAVDRLSADLAAAATGRPVPGAQSLAPPGSKLVLFFLDPEKATRWWRATKQAKQPSISDWLYLVADRAAATAAPVQAAGQTGQVIG